MKVDIDTELQKLRTKACEMHPNDRLRLKAAMAFHDLVEQHERIEELDARMFEMLPNDWEQLFLADLTKEK